MGCGSCAEEGTDYRALSVSGLIDPLALYVRWMLIYVARWAVLCRMDMLVSSFSLIMHFRVNIC